MEKRKRLRCPKPEQESQYLKPRSIFRMELICLSVSCPWNVLSLSKHGVFVLIYPGKGQTSFDSRPCRWDSLHSLHYWPLWHLTDHNTIWGSTGVSENSPEKRGRKHRFTSPIVRGVWGTPYHFLHPKLSRPSRPWDFKEEWTHLPEEELIYL